VPGVTPVAPPPAFPPAPDGTRRFGPVPSADWQSNNGGGVRLAPPDAVTPSEPAPPSVQLTPPTSEEKKPTPSLPVGIPQFTSVNDQVAVGLKPDLDGLDWLKANSYRSVLHVHAPGTDDSADRRQVELRGMTYTSFDASPQTLNRALVERFSQAVGDRAAWPLFVYDRDGQMVGTLWYLHFRLTDRLPDEQARAKAARLGLRADSRTELWLAVQKILNEQQP
jgi:protein tyrosine phosphatase (PTP) superfamily phosphohydrolase (DUF442 family)